MHFGYNTNGFAHHRLDDALEILAELGYTSVAITLDHHVINPLVPGWQREAERVRGLLDRLKLRCVVETGARFLLDPRRKHHPTLVSAKEDDRRRRLEFLCQAVDIASILQADAVSAWSGSPDGPPAGEGELMSRLLTACAELCDYATARQVRLAFEPEPGMFVERMQRFEELELNLNQSNFGLTLDVGHVHCLDDGSIVDHIHRWRDKLWNVHIEDMRRGVHEHLMFGEGEMDIPPILWRLKAIKYQGGVHVELSRHSQNAVNVARRAIEFLRQAAME